MNAALPESHRISFGDTCDKLACMLMHNFETLVDAGAGRTMDDVHRYFELVDTHYPGKRMNGAPLKIHPYSVAYFCAAVFSQAELHGHHIAPAVKWDTLVAALFHDVLEDNPVVPSALAKDIGFHPSHLVYLVSKSVIDESTGKRVDKAPEQNMMDVLATFAGRLIKLADRSHNMRDMFVYDTAGNISGVVYRPQTLKKRLTEAEAAIARPCPEHYNEAERFCVQLGQYNLLAGIQELTGILMTEKGLKDAHRIPLDWTGILSNAELMKFGGRPLKVTQAMRWAGILPQPCCDYSPYSVSGEQRLVQLPAGNGCSSGSLGISFTSALPIVEAGCGSDGCKGVTDIVQEHRANTGSDQQPSHGDSPPIVVNGIIDRYAVRPAQVILRAFRRMAVRRSETIAGNCTHCGAATSTSSKENPPNGMSYRILKIGG